VNSALQLCAIGSNRVIITSGDSKIRVANGDTIQKFEGRLDSHGKQKTHHVSTYVTRPAGFSY
jgi:hypothetical protein